MGDVAREQGAARAPRETGEQIVQRVCEEMAAKMPGPEHGMEIGETCDLVSRITIAAIRDAMTTERARIVKQVRHWVANGRDGMPDDPEGIGDWIATEIEESGDE